VKKELHMRQQAGWVKHAHITMDVPPLNQLHSNGRLSVGDNSIGDKKKVSIGDKGVYRSAKIYSVTKKSQSATMM
jgi:hypothetical protein